MQLRAFYATLLPPVGRYILFQNKSHGFYDTIDELVAATEERIETQGLYFATASYGVEDRRTQANVRALRAHRIDIDAGADKFAKHPNDTYPTQPDAIAAFLTAVKGGLPRPTLLVSSGEGLHAYWTLDDDTPPNTWKPVALLLNAAGKALGLKIDAGCTADSARVLRPVGTLHKNGKRVEVLKNTERTYTNATLGEILQALVPDAVAHVHRAPSAPKARSINDDILTITSPPSSLVRVAQYCTAVAELRDKEGNVPEPLWRAIMGVAKYCEVDGEETIHQWSSGYPGYDAGQTQQKFDRWDTPPTTCNYISSQHSGCATCKYRNKVSTPKQLGYVNIEESNVIKIDPGIDASCSGDPGAEQSADEVPVVGRMERSEFGGMALPDDSDDEAAERIENDSLALGDILVAEQATPAHPVPDYPELFDEERAFFYKANGSHWTLYHRFSSTSTDATGQKVTNKVVKAVIHKLIWADSSSDVGASETDGVLVQFGRVARHGSVLQDRFDMPAGISSDVGTLMKFMIDQGINPDPTNNDAGKHLKQYIGLEMLRKQNDMRFVIKDRFGYHKHGDQFVCCMGQYTVYQGGKIVRTVVNSKLSALASAMQPGCLPERPNPVWEGKDWEGIEANAAQYCNFIRKHYGHDGYNKARLVLALALASPFLVFAADAPYYGERELPSIGFLVSMYSSTSGVGKSALEEVICAAYGKPELKRSGRKSLMTDVAGYTTAQNMAIYPFIMDEVTQNEAKQVAAMVDTFSNGTGKIRSRNDGAVMKSAATWALVTCVSTNVPQRELLALVQENSDALQMRMLELDFSSLPLTGDKEAFRNEFRQLSINSGAIGLVQARAAAYLGPERLIEITERNRMRAEKLLGADQKFRFYIRALAAALTNIQILGKLNPFDEADLIATFREALHGTREFVASRERSCQDILAKMLSEAEPNVAVTQSVTARNGRSPERGDVLLNPHLRMPLIGRHVHDWGVVFIERSWLRSWCANNQVASISFLVQLRAAGLFADSYVNPDGSAKRMRLGAGLPSLMPTSVCCYAFHVRKEADTDAPLLDPKLTGNSVVPLADAKPAAHFAGSH